MTQIQFGFTMPGVPLDNSQRATFVEDLNRALELISGHFDSARIIDHLSVGDLESFTTLAYFAALHPRPQIRPYGGVPVIPQPGAGRHDGRGPAVFERRAVSTRYRRGVERGRVPGLRLRFPARSCAG